MQPRYVPVLFACFVLFIVAACSSDPSGSNDSADTATDVAGGDLEADLAVEPEVEPETTAPTGPVKLELVLDPALDNYPLAETITVTAIGLDADGNEVAVGALGPLKIAPDSIAEVLDEPDRFEFVADGEILLSACLADAPEVCGNRTVSADASGPAIVIETPARGAMLDGPLEVTVSGTIKDASGPVAAATLNGEPLSVDEAGKFKGKVTASHGLNLIQVTATDSYEFESSRTQSFLYSAEYIPAGSANPAEALLNNALLAYLDDLLFYNPDPAADNTLTYLLEVVLADLDIGALIPNPVVEDQDLSVVCLFDGYDIFIDNITYGQPDVVLVPAEGGLTLDIVIPDFAGAFALETESIACFDYSGTLTAENLVAHAFITISTSGEGDLVVTVTETDVEFDGLEIQLDGTPGTLLNWLLNLLNSTVANLLEQQFKSQVQELVAGLTDKLAETLAAPIEIPLKGFVPGNDEVILRLLVRFTKALVDAAGADLAARVSLTAEHKIGIENPGSLARSGCLDGADPVFLFDLDDPTPVELAGHIDLLNQALYSLWSGGALHLHVTSEALAEMGTDVSGYGVADLVLDTAPLVPPVITTCNEAGELTAQIGDFYAEADFVMLGIPADIHMYLFLELAAELAVVEGEVGPEIGLVISDPNYVVVEIVSVNDEWKGKEEMLIGLITDTLVPKLLESFQDEPLSFALPTINLGGLLGDSEEQPPVEPGPLDGKELAIDIQNLANVEGYIHVQGGIKVQDVPEQ